MANRALVGVPQAQTSVYKLLSPNNLTAALRGRCYCAHCRDVKTEALRGQVTAQGYMGSQYLELRPEPSLLVITQETQKRQTFT